MSYSPTNWVARVGTALNRFLKSNESTESVELTADPAGVSTNGTPFTATNMNKIEQGIYDAHVTADNNAGRLDTVEGTTSDNSDRLDVVEGTGTPQGVGTGNSPTFTDATIAGHGIDSELDTLNGRVNQGVKSTDSPTFANSTIAGHNIDSELDTLNGRVNQGVKTTDSPTLNALTLTGALSLRTGVEYNTGAIAHGGSINLPKGLYMFGYDSELRGQTYINGEYMLTLVFSGFVYSGGTDTQVYNDDTENTHTFYALKF